MGAFLLSFCCHSSKATTTAATAEACEIQLQRTGGNASIIINMLLCDYLKWNCSLVVAKFH